MPTKQNTIPADTTDREIHLSRIFDAPRELVWKVWTDPKHVVNWWGPSGFSTTIEKMEVRPGGVWQHTMRGPDGTLYPNKSVFKVVSKPERIVYVHGGTKKGGPAVQFESTWTFLELSKNKTKVSIHMVFESAEKRDEVVKVYGAIEGAKQTMARLDGYLLKMSAPSADQPLLAKYGAAQVNFTRILNAPREMVWKAWTEPAQMAKWWGPREFTNPVCTMELKVGGALRIVMRAPDGAEHPMTGTFREVVPPERLVFTMEALDGQGKILLEGVTTATFAKHGEKTKMTVQSEAMGLAPVAIQMLAGMEAGWSQSLERLGALVTQS